MFDKTIIRFRPDYDKLHLKSYKKTRLERHPAYGFFIKDDLITHYFDENKKYQCSKIY